MPLITHRPAPCCALVLLASSVLLAGAPRLAGAAGTAPMPAASASLPVNVADLNLVTAQGQRQARHRLSVTAARLCHELVDSRRVEAAQAMADCVKDALAPALAQLQRLADAASPALAAASAGVPASR